jgi:DNA-3-methyladenine glycosylase I
VTACRSASPSRSGETRCPWAVDGELRVYHDEEWGRPVTDERGLFERLSLEAFQSGLSWSTILRKREGFRKAFAGFDPAVVEGFGAGEVERLLADAAIVRNRAKIDATIANACAILSLRAQGESLTRLVWSHRVASRPAPRSLADVPAATPESKALAKALRTCGFRFVGPTTAYALMQAAGLVNDHVEGCLVREEVESLQAAAAEAVAGRPSVIRSAQAGDPAHPVTDA